MKCNICQKEFGEGVKCQHCGTDRVTALGNYQGYSPNVRPVNTSNNDTQSTNVGNSQKGFEVCFACGEVIPVGAVYCPCCGKKLFAECPKCGNKFPSQYKFCPNCGTNRSEYNTKSVQISNVNRITNNEIQNRAIHYEWVDLGLPSGRKWATCNIGATRPEEYGYYFSWGEVQTKTTFTEETYKYKTVPYMNLDLAHDAAYNLCGRNWRIPTKYDFEELIKECRKGWIKNGLKLTGPNGNSLFLPAAGRYNDRHGEWGYYWTSTFDSMKYDEYKAGQGCIGSELSALYFVFKKDFKTIQSNLNYLGLTIRPVLL